MTKCCWEDPPEALACLGATQEAAPTLGLELGLEGEKGNLSPQVLQSWCRRGAAVSKSCLLHAFPFYPHPVGKAFVQRDQALNSWS